eukprot:gene39429-53307_t
MAMPQQLSTRVTPATWGLLVLLGLIWGGSFFFARIAVAFVPPITLVFCRVFIAALALHIYIFGRFDIYPTFRKVVARVGAILKRSAAPVLQPQTIVHHRLTLDTDAWEARWDNAPVPLTATEFQLLQLLAGVPGKVFTRDAIIDRLHGPGFAITDRTIDSHVRNLRAKFAGRGAGDVIETRAGIGYRIGTFAKAHWPALSLRTILFGTLLFVAALPGVAALFLRVYENTIVQQTEAELVAQGAVLASAYKAAWRDGVPDPSPRYLAPEPPTIDLRAMPILPARALARRHAAVDPHASHVAHLLAPMASDAAAITLTATRLLDAHGTIVLGRGDVGLNVAALPEVRA